MTAIILSGSNGRMGQVLQKLIARNPQLQIVAGIDRASNHESPFPVYQDPKEVKETADVVIDFSHYTAVPELLNFCNSKQLPVVVATTGLDSDTKVLLKEAAEKIPVFYSANMSLGINVLIKALRSITPALEDSFDIEIVEKHHNQKKDAPSGTALLLADSINEACETPKEYIYGRHGNDVENKRSQMGIHAVRGGTIPGEHSVLYAGDDEIIELTHTALSRDIFANGALKAALFLAKQTPGLYSMENLLD